MDISPAERKYVRDGWRQFLYRAAPELKGERVFMRELLDLLTDYNQQFLAAMAGEASTIDADAPPIGRFLDDALESGRINAALHNALTGMLNVRPVQVEPGRGRLP